MNKRLAFYSDQIIPENKIVDRRLMELIGKEQPAIGYIPSSCDIDRFYFIQKRDYYAAYGAKLFVYFELDEHYDSGKFTDLLHCDAIHLSGGNTFHFLYWLRQREMITHLKNYVSNGGTLIGISAGAILMTQEISTASLCGDPNLVGLKDVTALGLVDFRFLPHVNQSDDTLQELKTYSLSKPGVTLFACHDGDGIIVDRGNIELFGNVLRINNGEILSD